MCLNAGVQKLNVSKEPETPLCLWSAAEIFCAAEPRIIPACPPSYLVEISLLHIRLHIWRLLGVLHTFGSANETFPFCKDFFSCFSAVFSGRPPAGMTSVRTPRRAIPRAESDILSCKEELTGGGMEPLTLISNFMQMII